MPIVPFLVEVVIGYSIGKGVTVVPLSVELYGIGNQLLYREECDYCAAFSNW